MVSDTGLKVGGGGGGLGKFNTRKKHFEKKLYCFAKSGDAPGSP